MVPQDTDIVVLLITATFALAGGVAAFFYGFWAEEYLNNKYKIKFLQDCVGGLFTGTAMGSVLGGLLVIDSGKWILAFVFGVGWVKVIQSIRKKIGDIVEHVLRIRE